MKFIQFRIGDIVQMKKKHPAAARMGSHAAGERYAREVLRMRTYRPHSKAEIPEGRQEGPEQGCDAGYAISLQIGRVYRGLRGFVYKKFASYKKFEKNTCKVRIPML